MKIHILIGEGIECEKESERFFARSPLTAALGLETARVRIPDLLGHEAAARDGIASGDWVFIPGGFSFADHFGSGRLLAFELRKAGFWDHCLARGVHLMGVCNGFQVLMEAGLFGAGVSLEHNSGEIGFVDRWIECRGAGPLAGESYFIPVRHGEGRIERRAPAWEPGVEPFLHYADERFDNGSFERVAGLQARRGSSRVIGLMPHPEVAWRGGDGPDAVPTLVNASVPGDGVKLMQKILTADSKGA